MSHLFRLYKQIQTHIGTSFSLDLKKNLRVSFLRARFCPVNIITQYNNKLFQNCSFMVFSCYVCVCM